MEEQYRTNINGKLKKMGINVLRQHRINAKEDEITKEQNSWKENGKWSHGLYWRIMEKISSIKIL